MTPALTVFAVFALVALAIGVAVLVRSRSPRGRAVTVHLDNGGAIDGLMLRRTMRLMVLANAELHSETGMVPFDGELRIELACVTVWQVR